MGWLVLYSKLMYIKLTKIVKEKLNGTESNLTSLSIEII